MLGDHAQRRGGAAADHERRIRPLHRFGVAERPGQLDVGAVEVERLVLGPQAPDDRARLGEASHRVREVVEGQPVRRVLAPGGRGIGPRADADAEVKPSVGHDVDGRGDLGEHRRWSEAVAGHQQSEPQPFGLGGEGGEQRPAFEDRPVGVAADRHQVVKQPRVLDLGDRVRLSPDPENIVVADLLRGGRDSEPGSVRVRHGPEPRRQRRGGAPPQRGRQPGAARATPSRRYRAGDRGCRSRRSCSTGPAG
jgi:hypothetical protein